MSKGRGSSLGDMFARIIKTESALKRGVIRFLPNTWTVTPPTKRQVLINLGPTQRVDFFARVMYLIRGRSAQCPNVDKYKTTAAITLHGDHKIAWVPASVCRRCEFYIPGRGARRACCAWAREQRKDHFVAKVVTEILDKAAENVKEILGQ